MRTGSFPLPSLIGSVHSEGRSPKSEDQEVITASPDTAERRQETTNSTNANDNLTYQVNSDPACWGEIDEAVRYWFKMEPETRQNKDAGVAASERQHKQQKSYFSKMLLKRKLANGEVMQ